MKILIVEDEGITSLFLSKAIASLGHEVLGIHDRGYTLLAYLQDQDADLILMDINIKGTSDGIQVASEIQKKYPSVSCVFITSYTDKETMTEACLVQPLGYLHKPVLITDIEAILILVEAHRNSMQKSNKTNDVLSSLGTYIHHYEDLTLMNKDTLIPLSKKEHLCLHLLLSHYPHHISKEQLILSIWDSKGMDSSSLRELISRLRKKMPEVEIVNTPNVGYSIKEICL